MALSSPYNVTIPSQDILSHIFSTTKFADTDPIWIDGEVPDLHVSLGTTRSLMRTIGHGLRDLGVGANEAGRDIVLSFVENQILVGPTLFGVLCAEGIHSTCSPLATAFELARQISMTRPKVLVCSAQTRLVAEEALSSIKDHQATLVEMDSAHLDLKHTDGGSILSHGELSWIPIFDVNVLQSRTACLIFSSGTTGIPKGVELSHANIVANLCQMGYYFAPRAQKIRDEGGVLRMIGLLQSSVAVGVMVHSLMSVQHGMQVVMMKKYDFDIFTRYVRNFAISIFFLGPPIYNRIVNEWDAADLKGIRWALSGGSPMPLSLQRRVNKILPSHVFLLPNWGMTELVCGATQFDPNELDEEGSVGRLLPQMEAMVVGDNDEMLRAGESGELLVKGPNVMKGYFNNKTATKQAFNFGGWFRTGDKANFSTDGRIFIEGRYKELIKYKGNQVSPVELEAVISQHPAVVDVGVIGVRLPDGNELPRAYVVTGRKSLSCKEHDISDWVMSLLSNHKHLRGGVVFVDEIPRNLNGKIMRNVLSEWVERVEKQKNQQHGKSAMLAKL